mgnify:CR=1 FL=1
MSHHLFMRDELFDYVVKGLKANREHWDALAEGSGLSTKTLYRIASGQGENSRRGTLKAVAKQLVKINRQ